MLDILSLLRLPVLLACFLMVCIGASQWQFGAPNGIRFYFTGQQAGPDGHRFEYTCDAFKSRMNAGLAFAILAAIFLFVALVAVIVVCASAFAPSLKARASVLRIAAVVPSALAWLWLLIGWPITESARSGTHCNTKLSDLNVGIARGLALLIATWVVLFLDFGLAIGSIVIGSRGASDEPAVKNSPTA